MTRFRKGFQIIKIIITMLEFKLVLKVPLVNITKKNHAAKPHLLKLASCCFCAMGLNCALAHQPKTETDI